MGWGEKIMKQTFKIFIGGLFLLILSTAFSVQAAIMYVGPSEIYTTISAAVTTATSGDTIVVKDGTYDEHVLIDKSITLQAENQHNAIIGGPAASQGGCVLLQTDNITIDGFTISGDLGGGPPGILIQNSSSGHTIKNRLLTRICAPFLAFPACPYSALVVLRTFWLIYNLLHYD
jgi:nitrous oxidase accessory protein NosD